MKEIKMMRQMANLKRYKIWPYCCMLRHDNKIFRFDIHYPKKRLK